ncbi:universal stress protein [Zhouia spongiae]|uniref:Universal stress protein n=1 Tax=Zhouia spongiae TaxID=2202721 RepID=A0ABY3YQ17_9FLAO|nr:universal stress protein [Zhouia spongiae]UNY99929.1 universal stress protein [Zhouia spongiae]
MKNILVPIGSNKNMKSILQYAIDFASVFNAKVYVFRAYQTMSAKAGSIKNIDSVIEKNEKDELEGVLTDVDSKNVQVITVLGKGDIVDSVDGFVKKYNVDLMILAPRSNSIKEEVFLGKTSGKLIKHTRIPALIVPENFEFKKIDSVLMAFKSGKVNNPASLSPLNNIMEKFNAKIDVLLVKTPDHTPDDLVVHKDLDRIKNSMQTTENATTFQGVLENIHSYHPDILCVFRRKRGFFTKLWEKNLILKREFHCSIPLLVLNGRN